MWIRYEPNTGRLIEGNCVHPITSGTQDFAGARGVLTMHDIQGRGEEGRTRYQGKIVLNAVRTSGRCRRTTTYRRYKVPGPSGASPEAVSWSRRGCSAIHSGTLTTKRP